MNTTIPDILTDASLRSNNMLESQSIEEALAGTLG